MCGVIGIIDCSLEVGQSLGVDVVRGLKALQHRGQDAAGIAVGSMVSEKLETLRGLGTIDTALPETELHRLQGQMAIAHTRYTTIGGSEEQDIQPIVNSEGIRMAFAHNGNLVNYHELRQQCEDTLGLCPRSSNDVELLQLLWEYLFQSRQITVGSLCFEDMVEALSYTFGKVDGGYAVVGLIAEHGLIAFRDPQGIRPLVLGSKESIDGSQQYCIASETCALEVLGYSMHRDVRPGELIFIDKHGHVHSKVYDIDSDRGMSTSKEASTCMFEWVYFSKKESVISDISVLQTRQRLGRTLGEKILRSWIQSIDWMPDLICAVPHTAQPIALAVSNVLNVPYSDVFLANPNSLRSFIQSTQRKREEVLQEKLSLVDSVVEGKNILLIDDSIVRGTTAKKLVQILKSAGAKSVYVGVACPPLRHPCFYGIDLPSATELIASERNAAEVAESIGADSVLYLDVKELKASIGAPVCSGCITGSYPTLLRGHQVFSQNRMDARQ